MWDDSMERVLVVCEADDVADIPIGDTVHLMPPGRGSLQGYVLHHGRLIGNATCNAGQLALIAENHGRLAYTYSGSGPVHLSMPTRHAAWISRLKEPSKLVLRFGWWRRCVLHPLLALLLKLVQVILVGSRDPVRITSGGDAPTVYLERWKIFPTPGMSRRWRWLLGDHALFLHHFCRAERDINLHDHPWDRSWSIMLAGWYVEQRLAWRRPGLVWRQVLPGQLTRVDGGTFHRVAHVADYTTVPMGDPAPGAWTLFLAGSRVKPWGFLWPTPPYQASYTYRLWQGDEHGE